MSSSSSFSSFVSLSSLLACACEIDEVRGDEEGGEVMMKR